MISPSQLCKCLGDETRLRIVLLLHRYTELCVCDLVEALRLPQPTVSRHLAQLRGCALIDDRREGQWVHYRLHDQLPDWGLAIIEELMIPARQLYAAELRRGAACCP